MAAPKTLRSPEGLRWFIETYTPRWLPIERLLERFDEVSPSVVRVIFDLGRKYEQMCAAELRHAAAAASAKMGGEVEAFQLDDAIAAFDAATKGDE